MAKVKTSLQKTNLQETYLQNLNEAQMAAVQHTGSNLLVHAGAGSGKTRVVIARIIYHICQQGIAPHKILAVTFTNRATREMRERLASSLPQEQSSSVLIRTFHAFGAWFLRRCTQEAGLATNFSIYDDDDSLALLKQAHPELGKNARMLQHAIAKAKESGIGYGRELGDLQEFCPDPDFPEAFTRYTKLLRRCGNADFADLLGLPIRVLEQNPELQQSMQRRFSRVLVDEYQDSNPLQNRLLHLLVGKQTAQELCIVGDEDQLIYGFRGAQIQHILEFQQNFAPANIIKLEENYRSCPPILELANQVISKNSQRLGKKLRPTKKGKQLPEFQHFENYEDEAIFIAQCIKKEPELRSGILYRTNAQSRIFERIFREWNIPYKLVGNLSFYRREEIKDIVAYLKCLANPVDLVSFQRIINKPKRGLGSRALSAVQETVQRLEQENKPYGIPQAISTLLQENSLAKRSSKTLDQWLKVWQNLYQKLSETKLTLSEFVQEALKASELRSHYQERDAQESTERCLNFDSLLEETQYFGGGVTALAAFLEGIELESEELQTEEQTELQTLITMHNTKGLEFPRVFITGLELGIFPKYEALEDASNMEEERRLFYVAITRAQEQLYLSAVQYRMLYGNIQFREISPLLLEVDEKFYRGGPKSMVQQKKATQAENVFKAIPAEFLASKKPLKPSDPFVVGARVEHLDFGLGYIVKRKYSANITTLMIKLDDGRLIRLQLEFQGHKLDFLGTAEDL